jgi:hypothetical protein
LERDALRRTVAGRLERRSLVWAGLRGDDIEAIADLPNLTASLSIIGRYDRRSPIDGIAYEDLAGYRPDLEVWDIEDHRDEPAAQEFRRAMLKALAQPSALLTYRASPFLSAIHFARRDRCTSLGLFGSLQSAFEHKPWVESSLRELGIPTLEWTYVVDEEQFKTTPLVQAGPIVLRKSRSSGGAGFVRVDRAEDIPVRWFETAEGLVSVARYVADAVPVNIGGTVWHDGVTVHLPSVQLTGIPACVARPFGHCGNDFGAAAHLDPEVLDQLEARTGEVGTWLAQHGYRGTFGVDYLVSDGIVRFTEVNPRFQGSTSTSARMSVGAGRPCLYLEHLAAMLGVPAPAQVPLRQLVREVDPLSSIVVHWAGATARRLDLTRLAARIGPLGGSLDVAAPAVVEVHPGGTAARITVAGSVTVDGSTLDPALLAAIVAWQVESGASPASVGAKDVVACTP